MEDYGLLSKVFSPLNFIFITDTTHFVDNVPGLI